ncbi:MAG: NUDIX domain-containing protein, partial [Promethearchaeota archaeon]
ESMYCPLFLAAPGGMLEVADIEHSFEEACMREVREEAHLDLQPQKYMIALTKELHGHVGAAILIEALATDPIDPSQLVQGNEEWTDGKLRWHPVDELESLDERIMLEGVRFATEQWKLFRDTGDSILF